MALRPGPRAVTLMHLLVPAVLLAATAAPAWAAKSAHGGGGGSSTTGVDVSYPQCGAGLPTGEAFGIVGLNGGLANDLNACFGPSKTYPSYTQSQLYWALATANGSTPEPKASLYVNTGDPGNVVNGNVIADWPTSGGTTTYGSCTTTTVSTNNGPAVVGQNSPACAWQYGYDRAAQDASWLTQEADAVAAQESAVAVADQPSAYPWWLDVETGNSWMSGTAGLQMNVADLQGMVAALQAAGVSQVGAYSTSSQWSTITGGTTSSSGSLWQLPDWIPGARRVSGAQSDCGLPSFTGGVVELTQWVSTFDGDYFCRAA